MLRQQGARSQIILSAESQTPNPSYSKEQQVRNILEGHGWTIKYHPTVRSGSAVYEPDFVADKDGVIIVIESKAGPATISDVGMLSNIKADDRFVVSDGTATTNVKEQADKSKVSIVDLNGLQIYLERSQGVKKSFWGRAKS
jgi:predicted RecB family endonuclease